MITTTTTKQKHILIKCSHPIVIYNKACTPHLTKHRIFYANGKEIHLSSNEISLLNHNNTPPFFKILSEYVKQNHENITRYLCPLDDGRSIPIFALVPCRRCPSCVDKRVKDMQIRATCENLTSTTPPLAVLLTYDNSALPINGVNKQDVDNFFKRLRITLQRKGYNQPIRMLCSAEYGDKRQRPHYHLLLWNFPVFHSNRYVNYLQVNDFISNVWGNGWTSTKFTHESVNGSTSAATSYYIRYTYKGSNVPKGMNPTFIKCSRGRGKIQGLGSAWLELNKEFYLKNTTTKEIVLFDKWSGTTLRGTLPKYFIDKLYPSISRLIPQDIRDAYKEFMRYRHLVPEYEQTLLDKYSILPVFDPVPLRKLTLQNIDNLHKLLAYDLKEINPIIQQVKIDFACDYIDNVISEDNALLNENEFPSDYWEYRDNIPKKPFNVNSDDQ